MRRLEILGGEQIQADDEIEDGERRPREAEVDDEAERIQAVVALVKNLGRRAHRRDAHLQN